MPRIKEEKKPWKPKTHKHRTQQNLLKVLKIKILEVIPAASGQHKRILQKACVENFG